MYHLGPSYTMDFTLGGKVVKSASLGSDVSDDLFKFMTVDM